MHTQTSNQQPLVITQRTKTAEPSIRLTRYFNDRRGGRARVGYALHAQNAGLPFVQKHERPRSSYEDAAPQFRGCDAALYWPYPRGC
ncbi:hypothetical protein SAMN02927930_02088 [Pseudidiomarina indica]|uniref:Uncharacterized protein n=1 Tax=Pseudidiomarina indica TaxID=1159017 RepID=A0A1G6E6E3_9GAMM|nr:hypothetical protein SAMN02927930_02088 [Pseudidiomarina indica]